jgi:DNA-binding PadR family transcriptional regulator
MSLPEITHLQFQVLGILMGTERSGQALRGELAQQGVQKTGPGFYQMMARLEEAGLVRGWYDQKLIDNQPVKERKYKTLGKGVRAWERTREFYRQQIDYVGSGVSARG